jgi:multimeric flavodoxin WrbA
MLNSGFLILGVNGSPNKKGYVAKLLATAMREAERRGAETKTVHLADFKILPPSGKLNPKVYLETTKDGMPRLQRLVLEADGIIFATPTHWFNMSSLMKIFVDRLTALEDYGFLLEGKAAGVISYGPQGGGFNAALSLAAPLIQMGLSIPPYGLIFDEGRRDGWVNDDLKLLAKNMLLQISAGRELKLNWGYPGEKYEVSPRELLKKKKK